MDWYNYTWNYVVKTLNSDIYYGLKEEQILKSREEYGDNRIEKPINKNIWLLILEELKNVFLIIFIVNIIILIYSKNYIWATFITLCFVVNIGIIVKLEKDRFKGLNQIDKLNTYNVQTIRNGKDMIIPAQDLVVGDIVCLNKGNIVPADIRLIKGNNLKVKENSVTGENYIMDKYETKIEERDISLSQMNNILFRSSYIAQGEGIGIVVTTGMKTQIGNIVHMSFKDENREVHFKKDLFNKLNSITYIWIAFMLLELFLGFKKYTDLEGVVSNLGKNLSIYTASPILIVLVMAYTYTIFKLKKQGMVLKNISSLYGIGNVNIVAFEKMGTLSQEAMEFKNIYINGELKEVPSVQFKFDEDIERLISIAVLCSSGKHSALKEIERETLEEAELMEFCKVYNIYKTSLEVKYPKIAEIPMDPIRKTVVTINKVDENFRANVKGFLDYILERCTHIRLNGVEREITKDDIAKIKNINLKLCGECLNVVALASRAFSYEPSLNENIESNLVFEGLLAFNNPLKDDYEDILNYYGMNCIKPIFLTKDNKLTAYSIGRKVKLVTKVDQVLSGVEISYMNEEQLEYSIGKVSIFSNIDDKSKARTAEMLKQKGYNLAMVGKNLKDLSYLTHCYVSMALGEGCSNTLKKLCHVFAEKFNLESCKVLINSSKSFKNFFNDAILYFTYIFICEGVNISLFNVLNINHVLPIYFYLYINLVTVPIMGIAILKEVNSEEHKWREEEKLNILNKNVLKAIIGGALPVLTFNVLQYISSDFIDDVYLVLLNFLIVLMGLHFKEKESKLFKNKISNILFLVCILLPFLTFLV
ncbi:cation-transporting P-type ATPase [Haloimpatiens massiliensis]|uniref:P-type ATPase n=1 Tax=Haloimpatiens massiliensis TaxID=1658110 RepID=UPI000C8253AE|nr:cation-transporting P-type ATPase [Haloimpatiens massiliensis]